MRAGRRVRYPLGRSVGAKILDHHRLRMLGEQGAPELLRATRPEHPKRKVRGDPAAQLNAAASSCPTCHLAGQNTRVRPSRMCE